MKTIIIAAYFPITRIIKRKAQSEKRKTMKSSLHKCLFYGIIDSMGFFKATLSFIWEIAKVVTISLAIILPIRYFLIQPFFVRGASMHPTFQSGDYLVINEIGYRLGEPKRGDVVVFRPPGNERQFYIKRIIGLPREVVKIEDGKVSVGAEEESLKLLREEYIEGSTPGRMEMTLGEDEYFVLGDNRNASSDSRSWGALKRDNIIGKAWVRAWPFPDFRVVDAPYYPLFPAE